MPRQRQIRRLTPEQLGGRIGMFESGFSQSIVANAFSLSQRVGRNHFVTTTALRNDLLNAIGVHVSTHTIRNRLIFTLGDVNWTQHDLVPVLFSDESRFCLDIANRRTRVRKSKDMKSTDIDGLRLAVIAAIFLLLLIDICDSKPKAVRFCMRYPFARRCLGRWARKRAAISTDGLQKQINRPEDYGSVTSHSDSDITKNQLLEKLGAVLVNQPR
ncbi:hypothetical protein ScPMuIL_016209 [Solemya velum]